MKKLVVTSFKGGVGKTTVAVNLAVALSHGLQRKVLLIDTDPSANLSAHLQIKPELTLYHLLMDGFAPEEVMMPLPQYGPLHVIPSSRATQAAEFQIAPQVGRERVLEEKLSQLEDFDFVVIDTAPSVSVMAQNAFVYAGELLIPVSMDPVSLLGASAAIGLAGEVKQKLKANCKVAGLVPTFVDTRLLVTRAVMDALEQGYAGVPILPGIRTDAAVRKSTAAGVPIVVHDAASRAAEDFVRLAAALAGSDIRSRRAANL